MEKWKSIKNYDGIYEISSYGRLKRILKNRKYRDYQEKILNPCLDKDGYFRTMLTDANKKKKSLRINRLVAITFLINNENKPCVNHINGIKTDNNVSNLEWCTVLENNIHAIKNGLSGQAPGEKHHMSKLKQNEVFSIKDLYLKKKLNQKELSLLFNISQTQISRIVNNQRWNKF